MAIATIKHIFNLALGASSLNGTKLTDNAVIDLKGKTWSLSSGLRAAGKNWKITNGTIKQCFSGAIVSTFKGTSGTIENVTLQVNDKKSHCVELNDGGIVVRNVVHDQGTIVWGHGGDSIEIYNSYSTGTSDKYWLCNFDNPLTKMIVDNSGIDKFIQQGVNEAAIRFMQIVNAQVTGLKVKGYIYDGKHYWKQAVQDRSGGTHVWTNCTIIGEMQTGWMTDPNIPIQTLDCSRWVNCTMDLYSVKDGIKKLQMVNCKIGGKIVNK